MHFSELQLILLAANLRRCRLRQYPGAGGRKQCATALGVTPQRWYVWERGAVAPSARNLQKICDFFNITIEWLLTNHDEPSLQPIQTPEPASPPAPESSAHHSRPLVDDMESLSWRDAPPGSAASFFWLAHHMVRVLQLDGLRIDEHSLEHLARLLRQPYDKQANG